MDGTIILVKATLQRSAEGTMVPKSLLSAIYVEISMVLRVSSITTFLATEFRRSDVWVEKNA